MRKSRAKRIPLRKGCMRTKNWKETFIRTGRTFLQAFIGYLAAHLVIMTAGLSDTDALRTALTGLAVSALAAGLAAVMNLPVKAVCVEDKPDAQ